FVRRKRLWKCEVSGNSGQASVRRFFEIALFVFLEGAFRFHPLFLKLVKIMGEERDEPRSETDSRHDELPISPCDSACSSPASSIAATPSPCNSTTSED
ncbi:unnamed protein product, partial [Notodromas monacha]